MHTPKRKAVEFKARGKSPPALPGSTTPESDGSVSISPATDRSITGSPPPLAGAGEAQPMPDTAIPKAIAKARRHGMAYEMEDTLASHKSGIERGKNPRFALIEKLKATFLLSKSAKRQFSGAAAELALHKDLRNKSQQKRQALLEKLGAASLSPQQQAKKLQQHHDQQAAKLTEVLAKHQYKGEMRDKLSQQQDGQSVRSIIRRLVAPIKARVAANKTYQAWLKKRSAIRRRKVLGQQGWRSKDTYRAQRAAKFGKAYAEPASALPPPTKIVTPAAFEAKRQSGTQTASKF